MKRTFAWTIAVGVGASFTALTGAWLTQASADKAPSSSVPELSVVDPTARVVSISPTASLTAPPTAPVEIRYEDVYVTDLPATVPAPATDLIASDDAVKPKTRRARVSEARPRPRATAPRNGQSDDGEFDGEDNGEQSDD
jgi:hypothetical protein